MCRCRAAVLAAALALLACSSPPEKERHQAEGAVAAARAAGAAEYASGALATAEAALGHYDAAVAARDYREALRVAVEARDGAYQAAKIASDEKARLRSTAERLATQVEAAAATLRAIVGREGAGRTPAATNDRVLVADAEMALQKARSEMEAERFRAASEILQPIAERLRVRLPMPPSGRRRDR